MQILENVTEILRQFSVLTYLYLTSMCYVKLSVEKYLHYLD